MSKGFPEASVEETRRVVDLAEDLLLELDTVFGMDNVYISTLYDTLVDLCKMYSPTHIGIEDE